MKTILSNNNILCGNCSEILQDLPSNSVDLVLTSPPYFQQREYGNGNGIGNEKTVDDYVQKIVSVFRQCVRVAKSTGTIVFNLEGVR
jgi:site-specific DNA-methyltransferase (adenine-specific)